MNNSFCPLLNNIDDRMPSDGSGGGAVVRPPMEVAVARRSPSDGSGGGRRSPSDGGGVTR